MYVPAAFAEEDLPALHAMIGESRLANLVTLSVDGLIATPLPLLIDPTEGPFGVLYGHLARPNPQWTTPTSVDALAIFMGPEAYVSPSFYPTKQDTGQVVPTWNYLAVHAYGPVEFFEDTERLRDVVTRLTNHHERARAAPWAVSDAPARYIDGQLRGIVGVRLPITRLQGKRKMSQNKTLPDRAGVASALAASDRPGDQAVAPLIPLSQER